MKPIQAVRLGCAMVALGAAALSGCGDTSTDDLPREAISGSVTLDGKPLDAASITFDPADPNQADPVSVGGAIAGGSYSVPESQGPTPGKYRVSILASSSDDVDMSAPPGAPPKAKSKRTVPEKYNAKTTLTAEVTAGGPNTFDFALESK